MWAGAFAHVSATARYHCARCDIFGAGESCWSCGSKNVEQRAHVHPYLTGGAHRYDPKARSVHMPGGDVPIENVQIKSLATLARPRRRRKS